MSPVVPFFSLTSQDLEQLQNVNVKAKRRMTFGSENILFMEIKLVVTGSLKIKES